MSVYTTLDADRLADFLRGWGLALESFRPTTEGIENSNYLVDARDASGTPQALVLTLLEDTDPATLPPLVTLLKELAAAGLPVPAVLPDRGGVALHRLAERPALLVPRLPGEHAEHPEEAQCRAIGAALARLHATARDHGDLPDAEQLAALAEQRPLSAGDRELLERWRGVRRHLPAGVIHGDLFRDNALFQGDTLTGLLDFYAAGRGAFLFDLAVCLNDWTLEGGAVDRRREIALVAGYETERALTDAERERLPLALAAAALRFRLSREVASARERTAAAGQVAKDPADFARLLRLRLAAL